jgi:hypothetical protein
LSSVTSPITYAAQIANTHSGGTATNYGLNLTSSGANNNIGLQVTAGASTGAGNSFAIIVPSGGGSVGFGTNTPSAPLEVVTSGATVAKFTGSGGSTSCIISSSTLSCSSDSRLKKNIDNISYGLDIVKQLRPVDYNWNFEADGTVKSLGFIAQEVQALVPNLVTTDTSTGYLQLNTIGFAPILTKAIQELDIKIEPLTLIDPNVDHSLASLMVAFLQNATIKIKDLTVETLHIGSQAKPAGITLYDTVTKQPYCLTVTNGAPVSTAGECGTIPDPTPAGPSTPSAPTDGTTPPVDAGTPPASDPAPSTPPASDPAPVILN